MKDLEFHQGFKKTAKKKYWHSIGRRKESSVTLRIVEGTGKAIINGLKPSDYFCKKSALEKILEPAKQLGLEKKYDFSFLANGGGITGQLDAARLAVARVFVVQNPEYKMTLKKAGFLTRDSRAKERKKPGLKKARKSPQWSKR